MILRRRHLLGAVPAALATRALAQPGAPSGSSGQQFPVAGAGTNGAPGPGTAPYVARAVHLDDTFWAKIAAIVVPDSPYLSFSGWIKPIDTSVGLSFSGLWSIDPAALFNGAWCIDDTFSFEGYADPANGAKIESGLLVSVGSWHHIFGWLDASAVTVLGEAWVDGVLSGTPVVPAGSAPYNIAFNGLEFAFPDNAAASTGELRTTEVADWWVAPGVLVKDVTRFRDAATGKPRNPAFFPPSAVLLSGNASTFLLNARGSQGALTQQAGTITNAATSPSD